MGPGGGGEGGAGVGSVLDASAQTLNLENSCNLVSSNQLRNGNIKTKLV